MPKPSEKFTWATLALPGVEIIEPPDNKKNIGWLSQEKPPYQFFNWLFNVLGQWLDYIDSELDPKFDDLIPIGSWVIYNDYGGLVDPPNPDYYWPLNGSTINDPDSPLDGVTVEDMSNRTIVGFGTEGGGDIIAAAYDSSPVGNANHQVNLQHSHTVNAHNHDLANHTHTAPSHTHGVGTLRFRTLKASVGDELFGYDSVGADQSLGNHHAVTAGGVASFTTPLIVGVDKIFYTSSGTGSTASGGNSATSTPSNNTSGSASPGTNSQLSATQSIQMRSQRVKFYVRYK